METTGYFVPRDVTAAQALAFLRDDLMVSAGRMKMYAFLPLGLMRKLADHLAQEGGTL